MATLDRTTFKTMVDDVARQLVATEHRSGGSFIRTPLLYPSGATVVVRIEEGRAGQQTFFVSDMGFGYEEADMIGASSIYSRHARLIAEASGVGFDNQAFFVVEANREQLAGAIITIANCSQEAAMVAAQKHAERRFYEEAVRLYDRLVRVFQPRAVAKNAEIVGASNYRWKVAAIVRPKPDAAPTIFEPVFNQHNSVVNAVAKFHDIARLDNAPTRVAVVHHKSEFGNYLGILSQAANVIDDDAPNETIKRLARAA